MKPFDVPPSMISFQNVYPSAKSVLERVKTGNKSTRIALAQLWLSEGIPYAFAGCPAVYEAMRSWLAIRLKVHAKQINMVGSGRLGTSLSPEKIDKPFNKNSDLDLFVVSEELFRLVKEDFFQWSRDYEADRVRPKTEEEKRYWEDNKKRGQNLIVRYGFIDSKMIPWLNNYKTVKQIGNSMWELREKLKITPCAPNVKGVSIRCYKDWDSAIERISFNLLCGSRHLEKMTELP